MSDSIVRTPWKDYMGEVPMHLEYFDGSMFEAVERIAKKYPGNIAFTFMGKSTTYRQMIREIEQCAKALKTIGVREGDKVTIAMPNCPQAIYMFYAVNLVGGIANMIHPLSAEKEIEFYLKESGSIFAVTLDQTQVENYVATLRKKYDSIFRSRTFMTSYGKEIAVDGGDYGWGMNYQQEAKELAAQIETGESGERTPVYYQTAASYGAPDYGDTYVEINLTAQHLFFYKDGQLVMESDFVSGNSARGYDTPEGTYSITYKQRNATLVGENYETPVSYWMPFNKNIGMHDATWRSSFGGTIYKTKGSHGCINMPYEKAQELYGYIEKGTPVICYHLAGTERFTESELEK